MQYQRRISTIIRESYYNSPPSQDKSGRLDFLHIFTSKKHVANILYSEAVMRIQLSSILFSHMLKRFAKYNSATSSQILYFGKQGFFYIKKPFMVRCNEFANILNYYKNFSVVISNTVNINRLKTHRNKSSSEPSSNSYKCLELFPKTTKFENHQPKPFLLFKTTSLVFLPTSFNNFLGKESAFRCSNLILKNLQIQQTELRFNSQRLNESTVPRSL